jgi:tRNA(adenine34) deaminase
MNYDYYMSKALGEAKKALLVDEVPIGAVIVYNEQVISAAHNERNVRKNALYHAEIMCIYRACSIIGDWRLNDCTMFVTVEPCLMCAGAILQARIGKLVFGTFNNKFGCVGSIMNILVNTRFNHNICVIDGVMEHECGSIIRDFFKKKGIKETIIVSLIPFLVLR